MELRSLRYFVATFEAGSLSRAAARLHVAQPALTAQLKKIESELGAQLFERSHVGVSPTQAGLQLYEDATRLLSDAAVMRERVQRLPKGPEGSVSVAMPFLLAALLMGPVLAQLKQTHPGIRVFVLDNLSLMVRRVMQEHRADVGILVNTPDAKGLHSIPLVREAMYFCGHDPSGEVRALLRSPRVSQRKRAPAMPRCAIPPLPEIDLAHAVAQPLVLQSRRFSIRQSVDDAAATRGIPLNVIHEHDSAHVLRSLFIHGAGFSFLPACALSDSVIPSPEWIIARVVNPELNRTYTLVTPEAKTSPATQVFIDTLRAEVQRMIAQRKWLADWMADE